MKRIYIAILAIIVLVVVASLWWNNGLQAADPNNKETKIFLVSPGQSVRVIVNNLKSQGLIKDPIVFFLETKRLQLDKKIQAGDFRLSPSMNADQVVNTLIKGRLDIWVTVPEGFRAQEIADLLKNNIPTYEESWRNALVENEGYLFPDTYLIPRDADINLVLALFRGNFDRKYAEAEQAKTADLTTEEAVIIASMIEREARFDNDRRLVSSVLANRLRIGMALQIDATVQYLIGYQENEKRWWKRSLTRDDLRVNSPYNTYLNPGLPPTAISNPGMSAIQAALNPVESDYIYYVSDSTGKLHFAETLEEHNKNIDRYL